MSNSKCSQFIEAALTFYPLLTELEKGSGEGANEQQRKREGKSGKWSLVLALEEDGWTEGKFNIVVVYSRQLCRACVTSRSQNMCVTVLAQGQRL